MSNLLLYVRRPARLVLLVSSFALIAACSGEPSGDDIERAVSATTAQGSTQMEQLSRGSSKSFMPQVHSSKKLGCRKDNAAAYVCDIEIDMTSPQGVRGKVPMSMRFVKSSGGWTASR